MLATSYPSQVFRGVHFALYGFNPITESKVRFKLVNGGAVDVGKYSGNCTHVIVGEIAYDDPVCVAARNDGKTLVTSLWVDHSADIGMPVDASSVMYRPLKDLNGIPGAQNLIVCLTGYQRQDRDDIMTMVDLMGAQFSKPLVANKVTHLICYKFEGEKYVLAKRLGTIKLVNHRWLEDCLKEWVLLPEENYGKSGFELEMMAEQAKDSEEEAEYSELRQSGGRNLCKSPLSSKFDIGTSHGTSKSAREVSNAFPESTGPQVLPNVNKGKESLIIDGNTNRSDRDLSSSYVNDQNVSSEAFDVSMDATFCQMLDTHVKTSVFKNADFSIEPSCKDLGIPENTDSNILVSDLPTSNSESKKLVSDVRSARASAEGVSYSDEKLSSISYSRKKQRGFTSPRNLNECLRNETSPTVSPSADFKFGNNPEISSNKVENGSEGIKLTCVEGSGDEPSSILPQKKIKGASSNKLKSRKTTDAKLSIKKAPSVNGKHQGSKRASVVDEPSKTEACLSVGKDGLNNPTTSPICKSAAPTLVSMEFDEPFSRNANSKSADTAVQSLTVANINGRPNITTHGIGQVGGNEAEQHNVTKTLEYSSPSNKKPQNEESTGPTTLDISNEESNKLTRKSPCKKSVAKRSLGSISRPKVGGTAKQKLSASLSKTRNMQQDEAATFSSVIKDVADCDVGKLQASPCIPDVNKSMVQETSSKCAENAGGRPESLDDETEAPDDKIELELGVALDESKSELVHLSNKAEETAEDRSEAVHHVAKCDEAVPPKEDANVSEKQKPPSTSSKFEVKPQARKRPADRPKKTTVSKKLLKSKEAVSVAKVPKRKHEAEIETQEETFPAADIDDNSIAQRKKSEEDKENRPIEGEQETVEGKNDGNLNTKSCTKQAKISSEKMGHNPHTSEANRRMKTEAPCFIFSGHRLQRKEFQQAIKRLKGRVCRDSHQWSYQATHFIAPEPIRRTEKFFAAAASGRWILKTDFITASIQAGKLLPEEPYEWYHNGLNEDGAINMEAPRKWRLLKERTGHGAFYGMRIIIYGDCITPPLDTLKRVIKAGDGTILATSPPYTRFLGTGIDYAIVSPGMPRVDLWVQEFIKHDIPCVSADYLVEYVCKPGSSLERHVLYGTHALAETSYAKLESRAEEVDELLLTPEDHDSNDTICHVCGSRDRGDVMLICGDESGSLGCGIGTHIDCCDPPLEDVPEEDWFCPKCTSTQNCLNPPKKGKKGKGALSFKRK